MTILHLEDNANDAKLVCSIVTAEWPDCAITCVGNRTGFVAALHQARYDIILSDFALQALNGLEALEIAKQHSPDTPFIFLSGTIGEDRAIEAVRLGAEDYILKDRMKRLITAIARALRESGERSRRRLAEVRIREQAEMLNQAREAIYITDLENRLLYWNDGAERLYGWRSVEVLGQTAEQLFDASLIPAIQAARDETIATGRWIGELRMHNRQREAMVVESRHTLILDDEGRAKAQLCINSDITDRKRLEEQFLRAQRMENIGLLAAGIAHDLNNMLAPILLAAPMLRDYVTDPTALGLLTTLEKSAERGANVVRQILSFAHGATGEQRLLQVKHLLRDITSVIAGTFPKSIRLDDYIPNDLWPIKGNPTQIHQVLLNLSVNARDAMPAGGVLRVGAENCVLDRTAATAISNGRPGSFVVLHVADTGTGIPPQVLKQMWQPFFTTKEAGKGTGLGLSTVRGIIENHNGFIEVETAPERGTAFRIFLPAAEHGPRGGTNAPMAPASDGQGELILVVDDEPRIREMTLTMLTRHGYRVLLASDGAEAAAIFAQRAAEIRLVITDLHMPNLDGAMLSRALRQINPAAKVLVVSGLSTAFGHGSADFRQEEFGRGFLHKPFKPEALLAKVHELLHAADPAGAP